MGALAVAGLAWTAWGDLGDSAEHPPVAGVFIVGDSLTVGSDPYLDDAFEAADLPRPERDAKEGRATEAGLKILESRCDTLPQIVVVALGTNDFWATSAEAEAWVDRAAACAGPKRELIWVNTYLDASRNPPYANYTNVNAGLAAGAAKYPGRVHLADWARVVADGDAQVAGDGVHYGAADYAYRADFYADAVVRAAARRLRG